MIRRDVRLCILTLKWKLAMIRPPRVIIMRTSPRWSLLP